MNTTAALRSTVCAIFVVCFFGQSTAAADSPDDATGAKILTPPESETPRVNGPRVFGVRPGSPFLYLIPATGKRPLRYAADGLPAGLRLDPATGMITGALPDVGEHIVTLRASNALGTASRTFRIVAGDRIALTPPMGWNSWNCWGGAVSQEKVLGSARAMADKGLEQYTHLSLWCLLSAPLLIGCDIARMDDFARSLLTNDEVLEIDQDPLGKQATQVGREGDKVIYAKTLKDGSLAVGLFNLGNVETVVAVHWGPWGEIPTAEPGRMLVRDLWRQKDLGTFAGNSTRPSRRTASC